MRLTLDKKIIAGFAGCVIVLAIVAGVSFRNSEKFIDTNQWVSHTHGVLYELEQILVSSVDAETGVRGFIITGDLKYLDPFVAAKSRLLSHVDKTKELTADNPVQQTNIAAIKTLVESHVTYLERCISARKEKGLEEARVMFASGEGKLIMDELRIGIDASKTVEQGLLAKRNAASDSDARDFNVVFITLIAIIGLVLMVVYLIISRNLKALRAAERETTDFNWRLSGSGDLIKGMQGNKELKDLAQTIIDHLSSYLHADIGALYIADENSLKLISVHAIDKKTYDHPVVRFGEGLAGQVAAEKKSILLENLPSVTFRIATGFGELPPAAIIAFPLLFENRTIGVIELGTIHGFTDLQKKYLDIVTDSISIAITSAQSREKTRQLLEETQRQTEELTVQQEELRQSNDELHAKTELLERSEGQMKVQQEELRQTNEELVEKANQLEEQRDKLEDAKAQIEKKALEVETTSKFKSEFLANMSHELRTPLNSILILAQLISENRSNTVGPKEAEFAKNIYNSGNDLLNLINDILDLSKVEAGKLELDISEGTFDQISAGLSAMFTEVAKNKSINFSIEIDRKDLPASFRSDVQRVEQILRNLVSNAFKFTPKGGSVTLKVARPAATTLFRTEHLHGVHGVVEFSIIDTGIGIPEDKLGVIFQAFQQADGSTKRKYGGTGLGLSISREFASVLGGEIQVESKTGRGSVFSLFLPLEFDPSLTQALDRSVELKEKPLAKEQTEKPSEIPEQESGDDRNGIGENDRTILIIEDDEKFAKVLLDFVRRRHFKGVVASQGNTGISFARHYKPDAILLDMMLPVMDGTEVLRQIKNDPELRHIPVQIISAYDQKKEGLRLGAFDYLKKPVTIEGLQKAFDNLQEFTGKGLKKLLIVEDNETQNNAIRELIGNGDVKCFSAFRGEEAYEMLTGEKFDCVIIDLGLPGMSGMELLEKIKANTEINRIPIVVYTGKELRKDESDRLGKLADSIVLKTADSHVRLLDETILFLHRVEARLPKEKQTMIRKLHQPDEVLMNKKILLVDDDIRNIYSLTNALEEEGVICMTAENGRLAVEALLGDPSVDLVLMDIMMPEMDGYEATQEIRKRPEFGKLPIIALTAKAMKGDKEKCLAVGMSDYISKPVNVEKLLSLMRVWLYR